MLVFVNLFLDLRVGDFRGTFVEQAWGGPGGGALGVDFDEFPYEGEAFMRVLAILASLWATALAARRKIWSWLSGEWGVLA